MSKERVDELRKEVKELERKLPPTELSDEVMRLLAEIDDKRAELSKVLRWRE